MSDPAVEAAQRAWEKNKIHSFTVQRVNAAREALAPLRELHQSVAKCCEECSSNRVCRECDWPWPCVTARLIYREDEL